MVPSSLLWVKDKQIVAARALAARAGRQSWTSALDATTGGTQSTAQEAPIAGALDQPHRGQQQPTLGIARIALGQGLQPGRGAVEIMQVLLSLGQDQQHLGWRPCRFGGRLSACQPGQCTAGKTGITLAPASRLRASAAATLGSELVLVRVLGGRRSVTCPSLDGVMGVAAAGMGNSPAASNTTVDNAASLRRRATAAGSVSAAAAVEVAAETDNLTAFKAGMTV